MIGEFLLELLAETDKAGALYDNLNGQEHDMTAVNLADAQPV